MNLEFIKNYSLNAAIIYSSERNKVQANKKNNFQTAGTDFFDISKSFVRNRVESSEIVLEKAATPSTSTQKPDFSFSKANDPEMVDCSPVFESDKVSAHMFKSLSPVSTESNCTLYNAYLEFIKEEESNSEDCDGVKLQPNIKEEFASIDQAPVLKTNKKQIRNVDIFGNHLTAKYLNTFTVNCPHCERKICARRFVRHLQYCMGINPRRSMKRSYNSCK